jgi:hypothetical protein
MTCLGTTIVAIKKGPAIHNYCNDNSSCELLILAAGFEDRAFEFISKTNFSSNASCILAKFDFDITENKDIYLKFKRQLESKFSEGRLFEIEISQSKPQQFEKQLKDTLPKILPFIGEAWIDISGLPTHAICSALRISRKYFPSKEQVIVYTAAKNYFPSNNEYQKLKNSSSDGVVDFLPPTMALEMSEVLMLEGFSGHRSKEGVSCLAVFAGYDVDRSSGVIESINPSTLLLLYGTPGANDIQWRLELSKDLHKKFESTRKTATEVVSTLNPQESIDVLEEYYEYLFEDYDFTVSPVCSKMQAVAVYLFWEKYKEVQIVFPVPLGYVIDRSPQGVRETYLTYLHPKNMLFRAITPPPAY